MPLLQVLRPTLPVLVGASLMLTLSMGLRQSLGIYRQPLTHDVAISISEFTLAIAVQNLAWGFLQPVAGAMTVRFGFRAIMVVGALLYVAGLVLMASAQGFLSIMIGAGVHRRRNCDVGRSSRGACDGAQHGARHRLGGGIARRVVVGADWADAQ